MRVVLLLFTLAAAVPAAAQESPSAETEKTVVVENTGGEWENAEQPKLDEVARGIVEQTNSFRKERDREPVAVNDELTQAAQQFAAYMAKTGRYGHMASGKNPAERVKAAGYKYCVVRENIAYAFRTKGFSTEALTEQFVTGWKQSPGHRRNMLARWITGTGVAVAKSEETGTYFAVQLFGRPESAMITFEVANESNQPVAYQVAGRDYSVEPSAVRTHEDCTPEEVVFLPQTPEGQASHPRRPVAKFTSRKGIRMLITSADGGYRVAVQEPKAVTKTATQGADGPRPAPRAQPVEP